MKKFTPCALLRHAEKRIARQKQRRLCKKLAKRLGVAEWIVRLELSGKDSSAMHRNAEQKNGKQNSDSAYRAN